MIVMQIGETSVSAAIGWVFLSILYPSVTQDIVVPVILFTVAILAWLIGSRPFKLYSGILCRAFFVWVGSIGWRATEFAILRDKYPMVEKLINNYIPIPAQAVFVIVTAVMHLYVLISLLVAIYSACSRRQMAILPGRAHPILILSIGATTSMALYIKLYYELPPTVLPFWYIYFALGMLTVVTFIRERRS